MGGCGVGKEGRKRRAERETKQADVTGVGRPWGRRQNELGRWDATRCRGAAAAAASASSGLASLLIGVHNCTAGCRTQVGCRNNGSLRWLGRLRQSTAAPQQLGHIAHSSWHILAAVPGRWCRSAAAPTSCQLQQLSPARLLTQQPLCSALRRWCRGAAAPASCSRARTSRGAPRPTWPQSSAPASYTRCSLHRKMPEATRCQTASR